MLVVNEVHLTTINHKSPYHNRSSRTARVCTRSLTTSSPPRSTSIVVPPEQSLSQVAQELAAA